MNVDYINILDYADYTDYKNYIYVSKTNTFEEYNMFINTLNSPIYVSNILYKEEYKEKYKEECNNDLKDIKKKFRKDVNKYHIKKKNNRYEVDDDDLNVIRDIGDNIRKKFTKSTAEEKIKQNRFRKHILQIKKTINLRYNTWLNTDIAIEFYYFTKKIGYRYYYKAYPRYLKYKKINQIKTINKPLN